MKICLTNISPDHMKYTSSPHAFWASKGNGRVLRMPDFGLDMPNWLYIDPKKQTAHDFGEPLLLVFEDIQKQNPAAVSIFSSEIFLGVWGGGHRPPFLKYVSFYTLPTSPLKGGDAATLASNTSKQKNIQKHECKYTCSTAQGSGQK